MAALRAGGGPVALTGMGGAGKSTLAAGACGDRRVRRRFRDGVTWLEADPGQDPVTLLGDLARRLGLPESESGFTTVAQGRDKIAAVLRGKRMLVAVDNVWERGPLDALAGLAPGCTVMFTTRRPELATTFGATQITVDELTQGQALELLGRWTGRAPAELPPAARALCTRVGNLALGVAMAGAMVARGRSFTDVVALIEQDLTRVHAELDPAYQYRNLLAAIEAGISDLPEGDQQRYEQLAVFAGRGPFPREAAGVLWRPELAEAEVGDLLAELAGRSLLTAAGDGWYAAHDLQYDVLKRRLGPAGLAAAHARLLDGYRNRYPRGWAGSATDPYLAGTLAGHLHEAGRDGELRALLTDAAWIQARLAGGQLPGLVSDYGYAGDPLTRQIVRALRLSGQILAAHPGLVPAQLAGRLLGHPDPAVADWATELTHRGGPGPWLVPLTPALTPTTTALEQVLAGHDGTVESVAVTADGTRAVSGGDDGTVRVWDLATGQQQAALTGHDGVVESVAVTADGTRAVSGGDDGTVRVWDLATGQQQAALTGHDGAVWSVAVTADGTRAVSGGDDGTVRVWDLATGQQQAELTGHDGAVRSVAVTADGTRAVSGGGDGTVRVWDLATGQQQAELTGHDGSVRSRWRSPPTGPGRSAAATTARCGCGTWPPASSRPRSPATTARCSRWRSPPTGPGRSAAATTARCGCGTWPPASSRPRSPATTAGCGRWRSPRTGPGRSAAATTARCGCGTWPPASSRPSSPATTALVRSVAVTADGTRAVSGGHDGTVRVWDLATGQQQAALTGHDGVVWSVAVTADGTRAVSGGDDGTVRVWDLATGQQQAALTGHDGAVWSVAVTADGTRAVSGGDDGTVRVWDLATGQQQAALTGHDGAVRSVAVTADGTRAVSGGDDGTVRVWDLATGQQQAALTGHDGAVRSVAVTADGARAVSGGGDGTVRVWDLATGQQQATLTGHNGAVRSVAVTADGTRAVSGGDDRHGAGVGPGHRERGRLLDRGPRRYRLYRTIRPALQDCRGTATRPALPT